MIVKAYGEDLAYIHDAGFGRFSTEAVPGLLEILKSRGIVEGLVVDLGCGSGLWAAELGGAGFDVLGIDHSPSMVNLARKKAPKARFQVESFLGADLPSCAAVTSLGECLNYVFGEEDRSGALARVFERVYGALQRGGVFVFDIAESGESRAARNYWTGKDWAVLVETAEDPGRRELTRQITSFRNVGGCYRREEEIHRLRLYEGSEVEEGLRVAGFKVRRIRGYGKLRFTGAHVGFIARKP